MDRDDNSTQMGTHISHRGVVQKGRRQKSVSLKHLKGNVGGALNYIMVPFVGLKSSLSCFHHFQVVFVCDKEETKHQSTNILKM